MTFLVMTLRPGHNWDGDFALYIMQAENIANGRDYQSTHFIPNPLQAIAPALYPPGLPLLLVPFYRLYGVDLDQMKWLGLIALAGWLLVFAQIARGFVGSRLALMLTALFGLNPFIWAIKDTVYSEFPFMLFAYGALALADRMMTAPQDPERADRHTTIAVIGVALLIAAAYLTRSIGIILFPVVVVTAVLRGRHVIGPAAVSVCIALFFVALVYVPFPADAATYVGYFSDFSLASVLGALHSYSSAIGVLLRDDVLRVPILEWAAVAVFLLLAMTGLIVQARRSISVFEVYLLAYAGLLLLFPVYSEPARYSMPIWPLLLLYSVCGVRYVGCAIAGAPGRAYLPALMLICMACPCVYVYAKTPIEPIEYSVTDPLSYEMFNAIKAHVPADGVVLARKPTIIGLFTDRNAAIWPETFDDEQFWNYARTIGAHFLVQDRYHFSIPGPFDPNDRLDAFVASNRNYLQLLFHNDWFNVYRLDSSKVDTPVTGHAEDDR
jgi:hypothetical protein